ncbi:hypothetical protein Bbelb_391570 [Branchiostoma belcheri]|nr:hypothetical protein Bbelb_391570 [Branchiostoma belcheri]
MPSSRRDAQFPVRNADLEVSSTEVASDLDGDDSSDENNSDTSTGSDSSDEEDTSTQDESFNLFGHLGLKPMSSQSPHKRHRRLVHINHTPGSTEDQKWLPVDQRVVDIAVDCLDRLKCIFGLNSFWLPLYAATVLNQYGQGIPIFFLLTSNEIRQREEMGLEAGFKAVFQNMEARPNAIIKDKSLTGRRGIEKAVKDDPLSWEGEKQVKCHLLLCWFHTKKAWTENLLPKLPTDVAAKVYDRLCGMMMATTWEKQLYTDFKAHSKAIEKYVKSLDCEEWLSMWSESVQGLTHDVSLTEQYCTRDDNAGQGQTCKHLIVGHRFLESYHPDMLSIIMPPELHNHRFGGEPADSATNLQVDLAQEGSGDTSSTAQLKLQVAKLKETLSQVDSDVAQMTEYECKQLLDVVDTCLRKLQTSGTIKKPQSKDRRIASARLLKTIQLGNMAARRSKAPSTAT